MHTSAVLLVLKVLDVGEQMSGILSRYEVKFLVAHVRAGPAG
jgi:hypothetical protein